MEASVGSTALPEELLTTPGSSPAIFTGPGPQAPAVGYVTGGVAVRITGAMENGRVPIRIDGPMAIRAWMTTARLGMRVIHRGRVSGTRAYLGPGDLVRYVGPGEEGKIRVEVRPRLSNGTELGPFTGEFPAVGLSLEAPPADAEAPSAGTPMHLPAAQAVPIYDRPDGEIIANVPASTPPETVVVLRPGEQWKGVRVGTGPYLVGYVNVALTPAEAAPTAQPEATAGSDGVPARIAAEQGTPLVRVADRGRVRFDGTTFAILHAAGFGREMQRYEGTQESDVFVAVDDQIAVRGMMRFSDLSPAEAAAPAAAPAEPTPATAPAAP